MFNYMTIHLPLTVKTWINKEIRRLLKDYGENILQKDTTSPEIAFDVGYYLALKRVKERMK